ncbi:cysteine hydrolase family protein [Williamwhitmania taraxaci]|uniref:Nicotinamidase-related amidase n=1 Tax=Williamwhitmania taraxaci TaxID=1640674 RepID=A0A1G6J9G0_9BACT|nr:cysteine hydrolase family protein [Williamwhitmania taraxaci]SDC15380.1 Nicotinamidase-related amidase [Williamwhitmania taraxaci]
MRKKLTLLIAAILLSLVGFSQEKPKTEVLLLIDIQDFYFPGGKSALVQPIPAAKNAELILEKFRKANKPVIHIKHKVESGGNIYYLVKPVEDERVITKTDVSSFKGTDLERLLIELNAGKIVICGMQTHMCVEAAVRTAADKGYEVFLVEDACATKDLVYNGIKIKAKQVQASTLATLKNYATIVTTKKYLDQK